MENKEAGIKKNVRYTVLDALRGFAAMMVVLFHFTYGRPVARYGFFLGSTGVDLFFIISGFVIFMSISKVSSVKEFFINRFSRLFPVYWIAVSITTIVLCMALYFKAINNIEHKISLSMYLANMTMFQKYFNQVNIDGSYWSLLVELLFYFGIAVIYYFNRLQNIISIGIFLMVGLLINDFLGNYTSYWPIEQIRFWLPIVNHFPLFFGGILFYKIMSGENKHAWLYLVIIVCYFVQMKLYYSIRNSSNTINFTQYSAALSIIMFTFILLVNNKLNFIVNGVTLFLGKISYSLYLIHQFLGANIIIPGIEKYLHFNFFISAIIALGVIILLAYLLTKYVEVPFGKITKARLNNYFNSTNLKKSIV
jgi:peptidoglycan/LPS O-acetylase OafA/YrhL